MSGIGGPESLMIFPGLFLGSFFELKRIYSLVQNLSKKGTKKGGIPFCLRSLSGVLSCVEMVPGSGQNLSKKGSKKCNIALCLGPGSLIRNTKILNKKY